MLSKLPRLLVYLLAAIFIINILQAYSTELIFDEAYYWYYAKTMAWGYFDHPPMVAWLIQISGFFFDGELGVRFMSCLLSVGGMLLLWAIVDHPKKKDFVLHFVVLLFSMPLLNAYGFFTLPDTPLLFFTALLLLVYKRFLTNATVFWSVAMGLAMAGLMYSKYNAAIIILLILFSNPKLAFNKFAWLSVGVALFCYIPHFIWLFEHDFVSIKYHLSERPNQAYEFLKFTGGFLLNLIVQFGFTFPLIYWSVFKTKSNDLFTRALLFLSYGVILFFFISSFQRRVQTQWLIVICIPMAIMAFNYLLQHKTAAKWMLRVGLFNVFILLVARVGLVYEPLFPITFETHGNKKWISQIENEAQDVPIVFENSYRNAPMYEFYTGRKAISLNNIQYRQNQYSIDDSEASLQHKRIYYLSEHVKKAGRSFPMGKGRNTLYGTYINNFESFRKLKCIVAENEMEFDRERTHVMKVFNPYGTDIPLEKIEFGIAYMDAFKGNRKVSPLKVSLIDSTILVLKSNDTTNFTFKLPLSRIENPAYFKLSISENKLPFGLNGDNIKLH
ncbi:MAG: ArnT family glycosyltransferase [Flavobacteriaceae bacterium]